MEICAGTVTDHPPYSSLYPWTASSVSASAVLTALAASLAVDAALVAVLVTMDSRFGTLTMALSTVSNTDRREKLPNYFLEEPEQARR
jgi:hypothetical protein